MTLHELAAMPQSFVPPRIAAQVLGCDQYTLNLQAKELQRQGIGSIGCIRYYFAGRNLRLSKADILAACGWEGGVNDD